jgi:hypothetical protein
LYPPDVYSVPPVAAKGEIGVAELDAEDAGEFPFACVAVTVNV